MISINLLTDFSKSKEQRIREQYNTIIDRFKASNGNDLCCHLVDDYLIEFGYRSLVGYKEKRLVIIIQGKRRRELLILVKERNLNSYKRLTYFAAILFRINEMEEERYHETFEIEGETLTLDPSDI